MSNRPKEVRNSISAIYAWLTRWFARGTIPAAPLTIMLAALVGIGGGYGAVAFSFIIQLVTVSTIDPVVRLAQQNAAWYALLCLVPAAGLLAVSWFTRRFAPEAEGHGVPEVITAIARHDGIIRPRVALVKILASGVCIGTGGSIGREGPIVQIGSSLGSLAGQLFKLSPVNIKVLVAAGSAAGISATFNAPLAGVIFASEIILGNFAVESLTPIVVASVLADIVQTQVGEHGTHAAFPELYYSYEGAWSQVPSYVLLGIISGLAAVSFTKLLYRSEDLSKKWLPAWWLRAVVLGLAVGGIGVAFHRPPPVIASQQAEELWRPPLFGVGYAAVDHALHIRRADLAEESPWEGQSYEKIVFLDDVLMWPELWWLIPLAFLKPLATSLTLAGGGSGGIFAPSLFLGATLGASFGVTCNLLLPGYSASPGVYAIVGMAAVVAGTTHGILSATLIVYEMTDNYQIILPIMGAAGLSSVIAQFIDPESIYYKKLSRRGEKIQRGHDMHRLEHIMVRDVMVRRFPSVHHRDDAREIIRVARANSNFECLPVMDDKDQLVGIIRPEDLHRVIDTDMPLELINAEDIALMTPMSVAPNANLLEALRDFGTRDVETLPVVAGKGANSKLVGLLLRADVMRRYRQELLRHS